MNPWRELQVQVNLDAKEARLSVNAFIYVFYLYLKVELWMRDKFGTTRDRPPL